MSAIFERVVGKISEDATNFVEKSFSISDQIFAILSKQGKTQKDLAEALGKKESEVSKWMTGTHNFTIKTIDKIERVLGERIIFCSHEVEERISYLNKTIYFISLNNFDIIKANYTSESINESNLAHASKLVNLDFIKIPEKDKYYAQPA